LVELGNDLALLQVQSINISQFYPS